MAKRQKKAAAAALAATPTCSLREIPSTPDFQAPVGATVNLVTKDHVGMVLIAKADYGQQQLVPAGQAVSNISFKVLPGRNTLKAVFVFDASISGRGELREDCGNGDSHFLRALVGREPLQIMRIIGK